MLLLLKFTFEAFFVAKITFRSLGGPTWISQNPQLAYLAHKTESSRRTRTDGAPWVKGPDLLGQCRLIVYLRAESPVNLYLRINTGILCAYACSTFVLTPDRPRAVTRVLTVDSLHTGA